MWTLTNKPKERTDRNKLTDTEHTLTGGVGGQKGDRTENINFRCKQVKGQKAQHRQEAADGHRPSA